eukprot:scaffold4298_cov183-Amphora_coffeaeformis.AAC.1
MIRGMIKKRQQEQAELRRAQEKMEQQEGQAWAAYFASQQIQAQSVEKSVSAGRIQPLTQNDYQESYQLYKDYIAKLMQQWISNERRLSYASTLGGSVLAGPVGMIGVGAKAMANLTYLGKFETSIQNCLADLQAVAQARPLLFVPPVVTPSRLMTEDDNNNDDHHHGGLSVIASSIDGQKLPVNNTADMEMMKKIPDGTRVALNLGSLNGLCEMILFNTPPQRTFQFTESFDYAKLEAITASIKATLNAMKGFTDISAAEVERLVALSVK